MRIAIFDYRVVPTNPIGGCHLRMMRTLADEHDFTVFSVQFDNPRPDKIRWVRVPAPLRPLALLFLVYHLVAPLVYIFHKLRTARGFDLLQTVESKLVFGDVAYTHFCHTSYLKSHWRASKGSGWRGLLRYLDHKLHACLESGIYKRVKRVVVPSSGLSKELAGEFPQAAGKISVLPNAVDVDRFRMPASFDRNAFRAEIGLRNSDIVFVFAALGHFERKGLPLLLEALSRLPSAMAKLLVVGGTGDLLRSYRKQAAEIGLQDRVLFVGMQTDVRPYLWGADAFVLASTYETFSLVAFESAAACLPLITTPLHGVEEIVQDGETGYVVERSADAFAAAMRRFVELPPEQRTEMGNRARLSAMKYDEASFVSNWRAYYEDYSSARSSASPSGAVKLSQENTPQKV